MMRGPLGFGISYPNRFLQGAGEIAISLFKLPRLFAGNPPALQVDESENTVIGSISCLGVFLYDMLDMSFCLQNITGLLPRLHAVAKRNLRPLLTPLFT